MAPIDMHELRKRGPANRVEELRIELYEKVNALGIGAQGLGGLSTVLDVKILDYPTHAASLPVAMIPNCAATRHAHFTLDGSGVAKLDPPDLSLWPDVHWTPSPRRERVNLDTLTREEVATWQPGDTLLLNGKMLTGPRRRAQAHRRSPRARRAAAGRRRFPNRVIYYVGPVDPVRDEVVGPAGPDDRDAHGQVHAAHAGAARPARDDRQGRARPGDVDAIRKFGAAYLMAVGGAAYLVSKAIRASRVVAFGDLGMEAIYEFDVKDMPVTVAVDARGKSVHHTAPKEWQARIGKIPVHRGVTRYRHGLCLISGFEPRFHSVRIWRRPPLTIWSDDETVPSPVAQAPVAARRRHGVDARPAAGAHGAARQAQSAHDRPHLPHRGRDHGLLRQPAVARRRPGARARGPRRCRGDDGARRIRAREARTGRRSSGSSTASAPTPTSRTWWCSIATQRPLVRRRFTPASRGPRCPSSPSAPRHAGRGRSRDDRPDIDDRRYLELVAPVWPAARRCSAGRLRAPRAVATRCSAGSSASRCSAPSAS